MDKTPRKSGVSKDDDAQSDAPGLNEANMAQIVEALATLSAEDQAKVLAVIERGSCPTED